MRWMDGLLIIQILVEENQCFSSHHSRTFLFNCFKPSRIQTKNTFQKQEIEMAEDKLFQNKPQSNM